MEYLTRENIKEDKQCKKKKKKLFTFISMLE